MVWVNRILALALAAAALPLWRQAEAFPGTATTFPRVALAVIVTLAAVLFATSFIPAHAQRVEGGEGERRAKAMLRPMAVFAVALAGIYVTQFVGFFVAMLAVSAALYPLLSVSRPAVYGIAVALLLASVYLIFVLMLGVPLTGGRLWET
jgi:hypothetical protein